MSGYLDAMRACEPEAFESRYRSKVDPWNFETSPYEQARYRTILTSLSRPNYRTAFEPGCSIGVLTAGLASRCAKVIATDVSATALARARERCAALDNVRFVLASLSAFTPTGNDLELIVFSEIGYYFDRDSLACIVRRLAGQLASGGEWVGSHWLGSSPDHLLHGDEVHAVLDAEPALTRTRASRHEGFRLDSWIRR